jgi:hypothetical protein
MSGIGSGDVWHIMQRLIDANDYQAAKYQKGSDDETETTAAFNHIQEVVARRFCQLLLGRFLLLNLLFQEARRLPNGLQEEHRRLWVLLQAQPQIFGGGVNDIFRTITTLLRDADVQTLSLIISEQFEELSFLRQSVPTSEPQASPFFCVLDEAQITTAQGLGDFISKDNSTRRPILREIWATWSTVLRPESLRLVLSGTGIDQQALEDTFASADSKGPSYRIKYDIGAFDSPEAQAKYIKRYVPAPWTESHWAEFLTRAWMWLRGR